MGSDLYIYGLLTRGFVLGAPFPGPRVYEETKRPKIKKPELKILDFDVSEITDKTTVLKRKVIYTKKDDYTSNIFFDGIEWIYCTVESVLAYDYRVWYLWNEISIFDDNYDIFFNQYWGASLSLSIFQLFYAVILDNYLHLTVNDSQFNNEWVKSFIHSKETTFVWLYHPELLWYFNGLNKTIFDFYSGLTKFIYFDNSTIDICITSYNLFIHLVFFFFLFTTLVVLLFNYYGNSNTEENTIDSDYLVANSTVEAEKEITSIDDYLGLIFIISYLFGVFFYVQGWAYISSNTPLMLSFYSITLMFVFILGMPTLILYDLGIFFAVYLRGIGKNPNSLVEVIFDYIACIIFYTRIFAQWIRVVLILVTFISLSHYVAEFEITNNILISSENQVEPAYELNTNFSTTYYILTVLPGKFLYWLYEICHTLFLVSSQFVSFFVIVFWLFLFLYTFFISEKHENFFSDKRRERRKKLKALYKLKSN